MRRTVLYILIPILLILCGVYFFFLKPSIQLSPKDFVNDSDLIVAHTPHVFRTIGEDKNKSIFQHILHLEGLDDLNKLLTQNASQLDDEYLKNLTLIITKDYHFLLLLDENNSSYSEKFWDSLTMEDGYGILQTDSQKWFLTKEHGFIICSNNKETVSRSTEENKWDFSKTNWKHSFMKFNKRFFKGSDITSSPDFMLNLSNERVNLSGYQKMKLQEKGDRPFKFDMEYFIPLELNSAKIKMLTTASNYLDKLDGVVFPQSFNSGYLNNSRIARFSFNTGKNEIKEVFVIKSDQVFQLAKDVFALSKLAISKPSNTQFLKDCFPGVYFESEGIHAYHTGSVIVFGERESVLAYTKVLDQNAVWAYSLERMKWVEEELIPSNDYHISNTTYFLNSLSRDTSVSNYLDRNASVISALPYVVLQKSKELEGTFTGMSVVLDDHFSDSYNSTEGLTMETVSLEEQEVAQFSGILNSKPFPVKSHIDKQLRFVLTDKENKIRFVNQRGEEEWSFKLDGQLLSDVQEVDLFKNRKIQYVFATGKKVYCVDRLGRMVENFPIVLPESKKISSFNLIDYDKSKNYRLAVTSGKEIWLFNSAGESLDKWNPLTVSSDLISSLEHVRIGTKDYLLAQETNGNFSLYHRNGDLYENYPVMLGNDILGNAVNMSVGKTEQESFLTFLTSGGKALKYDFEGNKINEEGLTQSVTFDSLFVQNKQNDFRYFMIKGNTLEVYDDKYVKKYANTDFVNISSVQVYNLSGLDLYAIFHSSGMTLVSEEDKIIMENISTNKPITLYYSRAKRQGYFYYVTENKLNKSSFSL